MRHSAAKFAGVLAVTLMLGLCWNTLPPDSNEIVLIGKDQSLGQVKRELNMLSARMTGLSEQFGKILNTQRDLSEDQSNLKAEESEVRSAMHDTRGEISKIRNKIDQIQNAKLEASLFPSSSETQNNKKPNKSEINAASQRTQQIPAKKARPSILSQMPHVAEVDGSAVLKSGRMPGGLIKIFGGKKVSGVVERYADEYASQARKQEHEYEAHRKLWVKQQQRYLHEEERYRAATAMAMARQAKALLASTRTAAANRRA